MNASLLTKVALSLSLQSFRKFEWANGTLKFKFFQAHQETHPAFVQSFVSGADDSSLLPLWSTLTILLQNNYWQALTLAPPGP